jgi:hypothetical protein
MTTTPAAVVVACHQGEGRGRIDSAAGHTASTSSVPPEAADVATVGRQDGVAVRGESQAAPPKAKEAAAAVVAPAPVLCQQPRLLNFIAEGIGGQGGRIHAIYAPADDHTTPIVPNYKPS